MTGSGTPPQETELKLVVDDRAALEAVLAQLGEARSTKHQDNLYFDAADGTWGAAGFAVRLRDEDGAVRLTVKTKGSDAGDFVARGEWETSMTPDAAAALRDGGDPLLDAVQDLLARDGASIPESLAAVRLVPVGSMRNVRRRAALPGHEDLTVEADETTFPNGDVRFEVELEVPDVARAPEASAALRRAFEAAGVAWRPSKVTKRERLERVLRGESA